MCVTLTPEILIIQDNTGYRLLHGHLHLAMALRSSGQAAVEVQDVGTVVVFKTRDGLKVEMNGSRVPLLPG